MTRVAAGIVAAATLNPVWALAESARAPTTAGAASDDDAVVEVRVLGERAEARERVPGSRTLITSEDLERAQPADAGEMLRRVPGLQVRQDESAGLRFDVGLRGLDPTRARRTLVLEDGVPLESNPYAEPEVLFGPTIERVRGIEIIKGSGSILYGPQTVGGVISFLTLRPPVRPSAALELDAGEHGFVKVVGRPRMPARRSTSVWKPRRDCALERRSGGRSISTSVAATRSPERRSPTAPMREISSLMRRSTPGARSSTSGIPAGSAER